MVKVSTIGGIPAAKDRNLQFRILYAASCHYLLWQGCFICNYRIERDLLVCCLKLS